MKIDEICHMDFLLPLCLRPATIASDGCEPPCFKSQQSSVKCLYPKILQVYAETNDASWCPPILRNTHLLVSFFGQQTQTKHSASDKL